MPGKAAAGGIFRDHATDRGDCGIRRVDTQRVGSPGEVLLKLRCDHARLHTHFVPAGLENPAEKSAAVDDDAGAERSAGQTRASAAGMHWDLAFSGPPDRGRHIVR